VNGIPKESEDDVDEVKDDTEGTDDEKDSSFDFGFRDLKL